MTKQNYPFTQEQLKHFEKEMNEAEGFENLMIRKGAMMNDEGERLTIINPDIEAYKEKYLTGIYEPLREYYDTEPPYLFWGKMYEILAKK